MPYSSNNTDPLHGSPSTRDIEAFVDARRAATGRRGRARTLRFRIPQLSPALKATTFAVLGWVGIAQWAGYVLRLLRTGFGG